jgi:hypothetical protein
LIADLKALNKIDPSLASLGQTEHLAPLIDEVEHLLLDRIAPRQEDTGA